MYAPSRWKQHLFVGLFAAGIIVGLVNCGGDDKAPAPSAGGTGSGPSNAGTPPAHTLGNAANGRTVFRAETFGNERFWTDAIRLPAGIVAAGVTPLQALALGLHVDIDALDAATVQALTAELQADPSGRTSTILNDPATTVKLINANAII